MALPSHVEFADQPTPGIAMFSNRSSNIPRYVVNVEDAISDSVLGSLLPHNVLPNSSIIPKQVLLGTPLALRPHLHSYGHISPGDFSSEHPPPPSTTSAPSNLQS